MRMIMDDEPHPFRSEQYSYYTPCDACGVSFANHAGLSEKPFVDPFAVRERIPKCPYCNSTSGNHRPSCPQRPVKVPTIDEMAGLLAPEPGTSLSLLIIDLGDSCAVKCESGKFERQIAGFMYIASTGSTIHIRKPFAAVRDAIDSQDSKRVPRIERRDTNSRVDGMPVYLIRQDKDVANDGTALSTSVYDALTAINGGKPLPIWTGGTWEMLNGEMPKDSLPCNIWRYTR